MRKFNQFLFLFLGNADWYVLDENLNRRVRLEEEMLEEISAAMEANEDQYVEIEEGKNIKKDSHLHLPFNVKYFKVRFRDLLLASYLTEQDPATKPHLKIL